MPNSFAYARLGIRLAVVENVAAHLTARQPKDRSRLG